MAKTQRKVQSKLAARIASYEVSLKTATRPSHFNKPGSQKPSK